MELSYIEAWVRMLRNVFAKGRGGTQKLIDVTVSPTYPFGDASENANLPNEIQYSTLPARNLNRNKDRRGVQPPEITVHDAGTSFVKKYMDNFLYYVYARNVVLPTDFLGNIAKVKNVMLERKDGTLKVLTEGKHYKFDPNRNVITFFVEFFGFVPVGVNIQYTVELYSETLCGQNEIILTGQITKGEIIGSIYSLEGDVTVQIDFWGADPKQTEWMLQRFRNLWINERKLQQALVGHGLITFNLEWSHSGLKKNLDKSMMPYLYNISANVKFSTEYRVMELASIYSYDFDELATGSHWLGTITPSFWNGAEAIRECVCCLAIAPYQIGLADYDIDSKLLNDDSILYNIVNTLIVK